MNISPVQVITYGRNYAPCVYALVSCLAVATAAGSSCLWVFDASCVRKFSCTYVILVSQLLLFSCQFVVLIILYFTVEVASSKFI